jgi:type IV pilus assembly protein PilB
VEPAAIDMISEKVATKHLIMPLTLEQATLSIAMADPLSFEAMQDVRFASGLNIRPFIATKNDILWAISHHYHISESVDSLVQDISSEKSVEILQETKESYAEIEDLKKKSEAAPVIKMVNLLISKAIDQKASDIHIEPAKEKLVIRNRVDGLLRVNIELPKWIQGAVISRIKIMAKLDIAEKRLPQDGRIQVMVGNGAYDLRVSTLPASDGEKIVIRILDSRSVLISLDQLGFSKRNLSRIVSSIEKPQGIILVTGPTGSGKTTTLYSCLTRIRSVERNIVTIEDPVEYDLAGINQVAIHERVGLTFASTLRSILRQDPDIVMVGEMRDSETATIAMQAALTGHLVFSTIHTQNSVGTITRLKQLGVPPYLIASTIICVTAQRLLRRLCSSCKVEDEPSLETLTRLGIGQKHAKSMKFCKPAGCGACGGTGYKGRLGAHEVLTFTPKIRELIVNGSSEANIKEAAVAEGMTTLAQDGFEKVCEGVTSVEELLRVAHTDENLPTYCASCQTVISADFMACPECGTKIYVTCAHCNRTLNPDWQFCAYCAQPAGNPERIAKSA